MKRLVWLGFVLVGCFNPDDILPIRGAVERAGQRVELRRGVDCESLKPMQQVSAGDDGAFHFEVFRAQTQNLSTFASYCLEVATRYPSGVRLSSKLPALLAGVELPAFVDWEPRLASDDGELSFNRLSTGDAGAPYVTHLASLSLRDGGVSWRQSDASLQPLIIDERVLHEFDGELTLGAWYSNAPSFSWLPGATGAPAVEAWSDDTLSFVGTLTPPSRGAACDGLAEPCPLTDGELAVVELRGAPALTLRFDAPFTPSLAVLRDLAAFADFEPVDGAGQFPTMRVDGLRTDGGVVELGRVPLMPDLADLYVDPRDGGFGASGKFLTVPLETSESLSGVRFVFRQVVRVREVSVF